MPRHRCVRPSLTSLEARDTPSAPIGPLMTLEEVQQFAAVAGGIVAVTFAGGRLTLTGDAAANAVRITPGPDGRLTITGNGSATQFQLNGGPAMDAVTLPGRVTAGVSINLGDGADGLFLEGVELPGTLSINGGNGSADGTNGNLVRLTNVRVHGGLGISNLAGMDTTYLLGVVDVGGGLMIRNGAGGSQVSGDEFTDLRVRGAFSVIGGAGFDKVDLFGTAGVAVGSLAFHSGSDLDGSEYRVHPFGDFTVAGGVQVTNGAGEDRTQLGGQNMTIRGAVVIRNGDGGSFNNLLTQGGLSIGSIAITSGAGTDFNDIHSLDAAIQVRGGIRFVNGAGEGHNYVGDGNLLSVGGSITFINGPDAGQDLNTIFSAEVRIAGAVTIRNGDGPSDTSVAADTRLSIGGATRITSGVGEDLVHVGMGRVVHDMIPVVEVGPVVVNNADGGSETVVLGSRLTVRGSVNIAAWDGTDGVIVAASEEDGSVSGNLFIDIGPGDQQEVGVGAPDGRALTVGGGLGIWTANTAGQALVYLAGVDARSWTEIWTGNGADEIAVTSSTFRGEFDLDTGAGDDTALLEWNGATTTFQGPVWVSTGDGNDRILVAGDPENPGQVFFTGASHWNGGAGPMDILVVRYTGGMFLGPDPVLTGFEVAF